MDRAADGRARPVRSFIALEVEEPARAAIASYLAELRLSDGVAWTRPENLHMTLKFLGGVVAGRLEELAGALGEIARASEPFTIAYGSVGAFPGLARPATLWVGAEASALAALAEAVEEASARIGVAREARPFHPHVTLGRVRGHGKGRRRPAALPEGLRTALEGARARPFGIASARSLVLFRSDTDPRGARYTALGRFALGG